MTERVSPHLVKVPQMNRSYLNGAHLGPSVKYVTLFYPFSTAFLHYAVDLPALDPLPPLLRGTITAEFRKLPRPHTHSVATYF